MNLISTNVLRMVNEEEDVDILDGFFMVQADR